MRILVTGGSGRVGRWVVRELATEGSPRHDVVLYDRVVDRDLPAVEFREGDVEDLDGVVAALQGADAVIHLAGYPRIGTAADELIFRTNVTGTFNVHEAASRLGIGRVVSTSSVAILGFEHRERDFLPDYLPMDEAHPVRPQDAYGLSKEVCESIARSFTAKRGIDTIVLRPPWVVSPEAAADLAAAGGRRVERFGTFTYIDARDLAVAYRQAIERPLRGHHVMFVAADDSTIAEPLASALVRLDPGLALLAGHIAGLASTVTSALAKEALAWAPRHSWRTAGAAVT